MQGRESTRNRSQTRFAEETGLSTRDRVFRTLVETEEILSIREIGRRLRISPSLAQHHVSKLNRDGALIKEGEKGGVYYRLQPMFEGDYEDILKHIEAIEARIVDSTPEKILACILLFLDNLTEKT